MCEDDSELSKFELIGIDMLILFVFSSVFTMFCTLCTFVLEFFKIITNVNYFLLVSEIFGSIFLILFSMWILSIAFRNGWIKNA